MLHLLLFAASLLLGGCTTAPSDKASRVARTICAPLANELSSAEMRECLDDNREMFLDFEEERLR